MESVMKTVLKKDGQRESNSKKRRLCKRKWAKVGAEEDPPRTKTVVLKIIRRHNT
jgi:hypothetical protein